MKAAAKGWLDDSAMTHSAALSYYSVFSIAPLLLISLAFAGFIFGEEASRNQIFQAFKDLLGEEGARGLQSMVESASKNQNSGLIATVIGLITLFIGSSTVFGQLQDSLNYIWKVRQKPGRGLWVLLRQRILSFSIVLVVAFLLLVSLVISAILSATGKYLADVLPGGNFLWEVVNACISFGVTTVLFAAIYKILPDVFLKWSQVRTGALMTSFFFAIGKGLIGLYLGRSSITSSYGIGGSAVVFLLWAYYSSVVLFLGAEFTRYYVKMSGEEVELKKGAERLTISSADVESRSAVPQNT